MFDPMTIGIGAALWLAFRNQGASQFGVLTPEREEVYRNALEFLHDPLKLEELANNYSKEGLKVQAAMLRKRAEWRGRSETLRTQHESIFQKAMESTNVHGIMSVAEAFEKMTATAKAKQLRDRAKTLYEANEAEAKAKAEAAKAPKAEAAPVESAVMPKAKANGATTEVIPRNTAEDKQPEIAS
jgi:hypothetical protein